ncbi:MAG: hypothetical protein VCC01_06325 [Candidatus Hydrogenedentota bacterium]
MRVAVLTGFLALCVTTMSFAEPAPVKVSLVSVCAKNDGRTQKYFGEGLAKVKRAIAKLDFDTFTKVSSSERTIPFGEKSTFIIDSDYSLVVEPTSIDDAGRIRMRLKVLKKYGDDKKDKVTLDTVLVMAPGKQLNLGGQKLADGVLIVVLSVM